MKKFFLDHPMVLKGLLAAALLANLSYTPLFRNVQVESINLSQEAPQAPDKCDTTADPGMNKTPACIKMVKDRKAAEKDPIQGSRKQVRTKPIPDTVPGTRAAQNKSDTPAVARTTTPTADNQAAADKPETKLEGDKGCAACDKAAHDASLKEVLDKLSPDTAAIVRAVLKIQGSGSSTPLAAAGSDADQPAAKTPQEIADGMRSCANDEKGEDLTDIAELTCQARRLGRLSGAEHEQVENRIDKLYADLKQEIKDYFESSSQADQAKGNALLAKVSAALQRADFKSSTKADKLVGALEGIKTGSELREKTADLKDEVTDLQKDYRTAYNELNEAKAEFMTTCQMGRCDYSLQMKIQEKYMAIVDLGSQAAQVKDDFSEEVGDLVSDLQEYKPYLSSAEYSGYIRGEQQLQAQLVKIDNPTTYASSSTATTTNMFGLTNPTTTTAASFGTTALNGTVIPGQNIAGTRAGSPFLAQLGLQQPVQPAVYAAAQTGVLQQPALLQQVVNPQYYNSVNPTALTTQYNPAVYSNNSLSPLVH